MPDPDVDICVIGGGPAGSVIARQLVQLGYATLLIDRSPVVQQPRVESLAPSVLPILDSVGLSDTIEPAIFLRENSALVLWGTDAVQVKAFEAPSLLVERSQFDRRLHDAATSVGVRIMTASAARTPGRSRSGRWLVPVMTPNGPASVAARFLVDARGKRRRARTGVAASRTAVLSAAWSKFAKSLAETRIEAGVDEWFWGCPMPNGQYSASIFLDAGRAAGLRSEGRHEIYRQTLSRSQLLRALLQGERATPVCVRDATSRINEDLIGDNFIRVGEAAFAIDPLSSQGVQRAILSAIQGAAAVHTMLSGCDRQAAMTFHLDRHRKAAALAERVTGQLYGARVGGTKFWIDRSATGEASVAAGPVERDGPSVLPSFVRLSNALKIVHVPVLSGRVIKQVAALSHPDLDDPIAYLGGVALAPLAADVTDGMATNQLIAQWTERMAPATARSILGWLCDRGLFVTANIAFPTDLAEGCHKR